MSTNVNDVLSNFINSSDYHAVYTLKAIEVFSSILASDPDQLKNFKGPIPADLLLEMVKEGKAIDEKISL